VIPAREPGRLTGTADDGGGDDRADAEQPGQASPARPHCGGELLPGLARLGVDVPQVPGDSAASSQRAGSQPRRLDGLQKAGCVAGDNCFGLAAGDRFARDRVQAADHLGAGLAQIPVMLGPYLQNRGVIIGPDFPDAGRAQRGHGTDRASLGAFLFVSPAASSRTRAPSLGCTSSTRSPAASNCWASR